MKDWSDEWKSARLALQLRSDELFQGETVALRLTADVPLETPSTTTADPTAPAKEISREEARRLALQALEARWRQHCDGARVDLKAVEPSVPSATSTAASTRRERAATSATQQRQPTRLAVFHQESRLALVSVRDSCDAGDDGVVTLSFRCELTLRVRAEFWQRPLTLVARVTPTMLRDAHDRESDPTHPLSDEHSLLTPVMTEEWTESHVLRWLREENLEPPTLTRRVEHRLRVVKPLVLKMETRAVGGGRVAIMARAMNLHGSLVLDVLDLQLHLNQFANHAKTAATGTFRIAKGLDEPFPITLRPQEQFNFVFIVEEVTSDVGASESPSSQQQSLLTMTWEAAQAAQATSDGSDGERQWQPHAVTEHHTIIWSATSTRVAAAAADLEARSLSHLLLPRVSMGDQKGERADIRCVVRDSKCPLSVSLAPLRADQHVRVGEAIALCVVVANRSRDAEFDLTLVLPFGSMTADAAHNKTSSGFETPTAKPQTWLAFEASHHLGRLRPGTIVRKSIRALFLQVGRCDIHELVLFDHASRTWFLPPQLAASAASRGAWEVFVRN